MTENEKTRVERTIVVYLEYEGDKPDYEIDNDLFGAIDNALENMSKCTDYEIDHFVDGARNAPEIDGHFKY